MKKVIKYCMFFLSIVWIGYSCSSDEGGTIKTYELSKAILNGVSRSDFASSVEIVGYTKLSNDTLLGMVQNFWVDSDGDIIINASNGFFRFDSVGNYLNSIGTAGKGPKEYSPGFAFNAVYSGGRLFTEAMNKNMNGYTKEGDFIKEVEVPLAEGRMANNFITDRTAFFDGGFLCYSYEETQPKRLMIFDKDFNLLKKYPEEPWVSTSTTGSCLGRGVFWHFNNHINFCEYGNDTVFQVTMEGLFPAGIFKREPEHIDLENEDANLEVYSVFETQDALILFILINDRDYDGVVYFNKETGASFYYDFAKMSFLSQVLLSQFGVYGGKVYVVADAASLLEARSMDNCPDVIKNMIINENDNPILLELRFRN